MYKFTFTHGGERETATTPRPCWLFFLSVHEQLFPLPRHFAINTEATLEVARIQIYFYPRG